MCCLLQMSWNKAQLYKTTSQVQAIQLPGKYCCLAGNIECSHENKNTYQAIDDAFCCQPGLCDRFNVGREYV